MNGKNRIGRKVGIIATATCALLLGISAISFAGWGPFNHGGGGHRGGGYGHGGGCGWSTHMTQGNASVNY